MSELNAKDFPLSTVDDPYTDSCTELKTVADLRKLIDGVPDWIPVYFYGCLLDTVYELEADLKTQECIEHNGKRHSKFGIIFQLKG